MFEQVRDKMTNVITLQNNQLKDVTSALTTRRQENETLLAQVHALHHDLNETKDLLFQLTDEYNVVIDEFQKDTAVRKIQDYVRRR